MYQTSNDTMKTENCKGLRAGVESLPRHFFPLQIQGAPKAGEKVWKSGRVRIRGATYEILPSHSAK